jgi:hypothetical protein
MIMIIIIIIFGVECFLALVVICYITHYTIWLQSLMIIKVTFIYIGTCVTTIMIVLLLLLLLLLLLMVLVVVVVVVAMNQVRICGRELGILNDVVVAVRFALDFHAAHLRLHLGGTVSLRRGHRRRLIFLARALRRIRRGAAAVLLLSVV